MRIIRSLLLLIVGAILGVLAYPLLPVDAQGWITERQSDVTTLGGAIGTEPRVDHLGRNMERPKFCTGTADWTVAKAHTGKQMWTCVSSDATGPRYSYLLGSDDSVSDFQGRVLPSFGMDCSQSGRAGNERFVTCKPIPPATATPTPNPAGPRPDWCPAYAGWGLGDVFGSGTAPTCTMGSEVVFAGDWSGVAPGCKVTLAIGGSSTRTRCPR